MFRTNTRIFGLLDVPGVLKTSMTCCSIREATETFTGINMRILTSSHAPAVLKTDNRPGSFTRVEFQ